MPALMRTTEMVALALYEICEQRPWKPTALQAGSKHSRHTNGRNANCELAKIQKIRIFETRKDNFRESKIRVRTNINTKWMLQRKND
jgi:hypothetical protein